MQVNVEVCITSVEEAITAEECGATSVEVCTWLDCGGVTPSSGLVDTVRGAVRILSASLYVLGREDSRIHPQKRTPC